MSRALLVLTGPDVRERAVNWCRKLPTGTRVEFRAPARSLDQNARMWAMLTEIAAHLEWHGQKLSAEDWKDMFTASLRRARVVPGIDAGTFAILGMRTSDMSKEEMSDLMELIAAFGAERGVRFQDETPESPAPVNGSTAASEAGEARDTSPATTDAQPRSRPTSGTAHGGEVDRPHLSPTTSPAPKAGDAVDRSGEGDDLSPEDHDDIAGYRERGRKAGAQGRACVVPEEASAAEGRAFQEAHAAALAARAAAQREG